MKISVKLYGAIRDHLPKGTRGKAELDFPAGTTIEGVLTHLKIDPEEILFAVNEEHRLSAETELTDGDVLAVFTHVAGG